MGDADTVGTLQAKALVLEKDLERMSQSAAFHENHSYNEEPKLPPHYRELLKRILIPQPVVWCSDILISTVDSIYERHLLNCNHGFHSSQWER